MKMIWTILLTFFICFDSYGQQVEKIIQSGNEFYKKEQYEKAASQYNKAIVADSSSITALFNLGNSLYKKIAGTKPLKHIQTLLKRQMIQDFVRIHIIMPE